MSIVAAPVETSLAELKLKAIQLVAACNDERVLEELLKKMGWWESPSEQDTARQHFEEFNQQYGSVLKRLAE